MITSLIESFGERRIYTKFAWSCQLSIQPMLNIEYLIAIGKSCVVERGPGGQSCAKEMRRKRPLRSRMERIGSASQRPLFVNDLDAYAFKAIGCRVSAS